MAKRNRLEIIRDILKIVNNTHGGIKPTPLLRRSNISSSRFKEYFGDLLEKGFVRQVNEGNGKRVLITEKGRKFLEKYSIIVGFVEDFGL
jgi:predicted transcriptional regulator